MSVIIASIDLRNIEASDILKLAIPPTKTDTEDIFSHLLRASIDSSQESASLLDETIRQDTIKKLSQGLDVADLDVRAIIGNTLTVMSDELGIDVKEELMADANVKKGLQAIMKSSLSELENNLATIDASSYGNVTTEDGIVNMFDKLSDQLREDDSTGFIDKKLSQDETFQRLLKDQELKSKQLVESRKKLQESSKNLENIMAEYEYTVPPLT